MNTIKLKEGSEIPMLGLGTYQLRGEDCFKSVKYALEVGYRHIDTADRYHNHTQVGEAIQHSGLSRDELFLTSKVWRTDLARQEVVNSGKRFLEELQLDYLDLLLIHWPNHKFPMQTTLEGFQQLKEAGIIRAIGVSNFTMHHLQDALARGIEFSNNQVEYHPSLNQIELKKFCEQNNITVTAYSPIAQGEDLKLPAVRGLAKKYKRSESQVTLNWLMSKGLVVIPRSSNPEHILDNFKATEWKIQADDIQIIDKIGGNNRIILPEYNEFNY